MEQAIEHLLTHCGSLKNHEKLLILCDETTKNLASEFHDNALNITKNVQLRELPVATRHGAEPCDETRDYMLKSDLIISLCKFSLAHSMARIDAGRHGARFLSMPLYSEELMFNPAVMCNYREQLKVVKFVSQAFTDGKDIHVFTKAGTDIKISCAGRIGNCCPGFVEQPGDLGSPPDIEANVSPIEDSANGIVVIDGSITCPELGILTTPVILTVEQGKITKIQSERQDYVTILTEMLGEIGSKKRILAECGVGLNPLAVLTGTMLTDEGAWGCMHFGFGSNYTVGGENKVDFHLDFVFKDASLKIDNQLIINNGDVLYV